MKRTLLAAFVVLVGCAGGMHAPWSDDRPVRLYVFDGGTLRVPDPARLGFRKDEVAESDLAIACYLIVHPKGLLMWDTCAVPDAEWTPTGSAVDHHMKLEDSQDRVISILEPLQAQLAKAGLSAAQVNYLALSHYHYDHTGNANQFAAATWFVRRAERDAMFTEPAPAVTRPSTYAALHSSKAVLLERDTYDLFGDGTVVIKSALGHTPGHQILFVKLAKTGSVVLSGDLYHYPEERSLDRVPTFEWDPQQTRAARVALDRFLEQTGARLWIQHDLAANRRLKKAPDFYE